MALAGHGVAHKAHIISIIWPCWATEWPNKHHLCRQPPHHAHKASFGLGWPQNGPPGAHHHQHHLGSGLASEPGNPYGWPTRPASSASFGLEPGMQRPPGAHHEHHLALAGHGVAHQEGTISIIWLWLASEPGTRHAS